MQRTLILALCVCFVAVCCATPSDVFTSDDAARVTNTLNGRQSSNGLFGTFEETQNALAALDLLGARAENTEALCGTLSTLIQETASSEKNKNAERWFNLASSLLSPASQCGASALSGVADVLRDTIQAAIKSDRISSNYFGGRLAVLLSSAPASLFSANDFDLAGLATKVLDLVEDDGTTRASASSDETGTLYSGYAFSLLSELNAEPSKLRSLAQKVNALISRGHRSHQTLYFTTGNRSPITVTGVVLNGIAALARVSADKIDATPDDMDYLANFFTQNKYVQAPKEIYSLVSSLRILADNNINVPLAITVSAKDNQGVVRVTNVLNEFATDAEVTLRKATSVSDASVVAEKATLSVSESNNAEYNLDLGNFAPGFYDLSLKIKPANRGERFATTKAKRRLKIVTDVTPNTLAIAVRTTNSNGTESQNSVTFPNSLSEVTEVERYAVLQFDLSLNGDYQPHQVFLELVREDNKKQAVFVLKRSGNEYSATLDTETNEFLENIHGSGNYKLKVIVGDAVLKQSTSWIVGSLSLNVKSFVRTNAAQNLQPLPEIEHVFRQPEARPSKTISTAFTGLVLAPFGILLIAILLSGLRFSFPSNVTQFFYALLFHGSIGTILVGYAYYWFRANIFQTLAAVFILGAAAVLTSRFALRGTVLSFEKEKKN